MLNNKYRELNYKSLKSHTPYFSNTFALNAPWKNTPVETGVFFHAVQGLGFEPLAKRSEAIGGSHCEAICGRLYPNFCLHHRSIPTPAHHNFYFPYQL